MLDFKYDEPQPVQETQRIQSDLIQYKNKVFYGRVVGGALVAPSPRGWTISNPSGGTYDITHGLRTQKIAVIVTPEDSTFGSWKAQLNTKTDDSVRILTYNAANGNANVDFSFIIAT